jgi:tripartite-type tricarboxylate transporter receptor subunit TctC
MKLGRREFLQLVAGGAALPAASRIDGAPAQSYPSRPIAMIVPGAAGASTDTLGRIIGERMRGSLGQPIIIENVGGADGSIGAGRAVRAKPDGYTIDLGYLGNHVLNGAVYSLQYDVLNDFAPISPLVTTSLFLFARRTIPAQDLNELIAWLKANRNKASMGVTAVGPRLVNEWFRRETGTQYTLVPYRGNAPASQDLLAGQIDLFLASPDPGLALARTGIIKVYAVASETRSALAPEVPTFAELGLPKILWSGWYGLFAPKGMSKEIVGKLNAAAVDALADPAIRSRLIDLGFEPFPRQQQTPEALGALVKADAEKWWPVIRELGIRGE